MNFNRQESAQRTNSNVELRSSKTQHSGQRLPSPDAKYNPEKAMRQAERDYLESKGVVRKNIFQKIKGWLLRR